MKYNCFSIPQMQFLLINGAKPIFVQEHHNSKRLFLVFEQNEQLSELLTIWKNNKAN